MQQLKILYSRKGSQKNLTRSSTNKDAYASINPYRTYVFALLDPDLRNKGPNPPDVKKLKLHSNFSEATLNIFRSFSHLMTFNHKKIYFPSFYS
jgi:hypothetical protein